jgi:hypothetical protein
MAETDLHCGVLGLRRDLRGEALAVTKNKSDPPKFRKAYVKIKNEINDAFIEDEMERLKELIRMIPAHRPAK